MGKMIRKPALWRRVVRALRDWVMQDGGGPSFYLDDVRVMKAKRGVYKK